MRRAETTTIEGLSQPDVLHPIQQSFLDHGAVQCGFCTPGMILASKGLLDENPAPMEHEVREALSVTFAGAPVTSRSSRRSWPWGRKGETFEGWHTMKHHVVGERISRQDGVAKVTGNATFIVDLQMRGMLHAKILQALILTQKSFASIHGKDSRSPAFGPSPAMRTFPVTYTAAARGPCPR